MPVGESLAGAAGVVVGTRAAVVVVGLAHVVKAVAVVGAGFTGARNVLCYPNAGDDVHDIDTGTVQDFESSERREGIASQPPPCGFAVDPQNPGDFGRSAAEFP